MTRRKELMPSDVTDHVSLFDRIATITNDVVSHASFFTACLLSVIIWLPSYFVFDNADTWQLTMNTIASMATYLLVALLQNAQTRANKAAQHKLNAISAALADLMTAMAQDKPELTRDVQELRDAVGLEEWESS